MKAPMEKVNDGELIARLFEEKRHLSQQAETWKLAWKESTDRELQKEAEIAKLKEQLKAQGEPIGYMASHRVDALKTTNVCTTITMHKAFSTDVAIYAAPPIPTNMTLVNTDTLYHLFEYWNGSTNETDMENALNYIQGRLGDLCGS